MGTRYDPIAQLGTFCTAALLFFGSWGMAPAVAGGGNHLVQTATYLGGTGGNNYVGGLGIAPDRSIVFGGTLFGDDWFGIGATDLHGGGNGTIVRFDSTGTTPLSVTRVGQSISDMALDSSGRIVVATNGLGAAMLSADAGSVLWSDPEIGHVSRIAVGSNGVVAALTYDRQVYTYDSLGNRLGHLSLGDNYVEDIAVHGASGQVIVTGYNNRTLIMRNMQSGPVQVAFMRSFSSDLTEHQWTNYNWSGWPLGAPEAGGEGLEADSRGYRLTIGADDKLYFAAESAGGNSIFLRDPKDLYADLDPGVNVAFDNYNSAWGTASNHITHYGRFDPETGELEHNQWLLARIPANNAGNTIRPRAIAADEEGRVYVAGFSFFSIHARDANLINQEPVGPYMGGEAFLLRVSEDFGEREMWTPFTREGPTHSYGPDFLGKEHYAIAVRDGTWAMAATISDGQAITTANALQPFRLGDGSTVYLVVGLLDDPGAPRLIIDYGGQLYAEGRQDIRSRFETREVQIDISGDGINNDSRAYYAFSTTDPLTPADWNGPEIFGGFMGEAVNRPNSSFGWRYVYEDGRFSINYQTTGEGETGRFYGAIYVDKKDFVGGGSDAPVTFETGSSLHLLGMNRWENLGEVRWLIREGDTFYVSDILVNRIEGQAALYFADDEDHGLWASFDPYDSLLFDAASAEFMSMTFVDVTGAGFVMTKSEFTNSRHWMEFAGIEMKAVLQAETLLGDINGDGRVDDLDLAILQANLGEFVSGDGGLPGDLTGNGRVDLYDAYLLFQNYQPGGPVGQTAVPEPATLMLLVIGSLAIAGRRR